MGWIKRPDFVASNGTHIDDTYGLHVMCTARRQEKHRLTPSEAEALREYFAANPGRKPWHDARPGQIWDVDLERGGIRAVTVYGSEHRDPVVVFRDVYKGDEYDFTDTAIRDARRVWPEEG